MREMRKATRAISDEINTTRAAIEEPARELAEPFQDVADAAKAAGSVAAAARNPGQAFRDSVMRELNTPVKPTRVALKPAGDENTIAPPQLPHKADRGSLGAAAAATEPVPALPEPEEPVAAARSQEPATHPAAAEAPVAPSPLPEEPAPAPSRACRTVA